jgi:hypothetical protein
MVRVELMIRLILIGVISLFVVGCTPKYKVVHEYVTPYTSMGKMCANRCYIDRKNCEVNCGQKYDICAIDAQRVGEQNYNIALIEYHRLMHIWEVEKVQYDLKYDRYQSDKDMYEDEYKHYKELCKKDKNDHYSCKKRKFYKDKLRYLDYPTYPTKPYQPSLAKEVKNAKNSLCTKECGCMDRFHSCFSSCGGKVISKKVCIENCP